MVEKNNESPILTSNSDLKEFEDEEEFDILNVFTMTAKELLHHIGSTSIRILFLLFFYFLV